MSQEDCQQIEDFLKSLLFKSPSDPSNSYDNISSNESSVFHSDVPIKTPFHDSEIGGQSDLLLSNIRQSTNSELIDRAALARFAAVNLESYHRALEHPGSQCRYTANALEQPGTQSRYAVNTLEQPDAQSRNYMLFNANPAADKDTHPSENLFCRNLFSRDIASEERVERWDNNYDSEQRRFSFIPGIKENGIGSPISFPIMPLPIGSEIAQNSSAKEIFHHQQVDPQTRQNKGNDTSQKKSSKKKKRGGTSARNRTLRSLLPEEKSTEEVVDVNNDTTDSETVKKEIVIPKPPRLKLTANYAFRKGKQGNLTFHCDACDISVSGEPNIMKHLSLPSHVKKVQLLETDKYLHKLPAPIDAQVAALDYFIQNIADVYGLNPSQVATRHEIAQQIHTLVSKSLPECSVEATGSSVNGFGMKRSELDLLLRVPPKANAAEMLAATSELLVKEKGSESVTNEFKEKIPRIQFREKSHVVCYISIENGNALQMTRLLELYSCLDERVAVLGKAFRYWADHCQLTKPDKGTLPPFAFVILLIYFLQQQQPPVLPVLHELPAFNDCADIKDFRMKWRSKNKSSTGLLWLKLFQFYCFKYKSGTDVVSIRSSKKITCSQRNWNTKCIAIEDPFSNRNLAHVIANLSVFQYIMECFLNTYRYFGYPRLKSGPIKFVKDTFDACSSNATSACETPTRSITAGETSTSVDLDSGTDGTLDDLLEDHDDEIPLEDVIATMSKMSLLTAQDKGNSSGLESTSTSNETVSEKAQEEVSPVIDNASASSQNVSRNEEIGNTENNHNLLDMVHSDEQAKFSWDVRDEDVTKEMMKYEFLPGVFKGEKSLPLVCRVCGKSGHLKNNCPTEKLPPINTLPPMTKQFMKAVSDVCYDIIKENRPSLQYCHYRERDTLWLQTVIQDIYPNAILKMFGSFRNGFCFTNSDMDFCLTFKGEDGKNLDQAVVIERLAERLQKCDRLKNIIPILSAKVPILKFFDMQAQLEADISLYNTLAQYNTRMLETYCNIDERVQIIGYVFKYFAKILGICDASKGSLSSYAYILMALYFLQQRKPPVIPVLQELHDGEMPEENVDGWNAWFFEDLANLKNVWKGHNKNTESVGELWLGLLNFFVSEFNMRDHVISIRQKKPVSRFSKLWNSKKIAIEDPFDLSHNLGSGLSRKMNNYIMKALIRGREHFGTPAPLKQMYLSNKNGLKGYLFDRRFLNDGNEPPKDRGCRYCGKIGHKFADCPIRNNVPKRDDNRRNRKVEPKSGADQQQQHHNKRQYDAPMKARTRHNTSPNKPVTANKSLPERRQLVPERRQLVPERRQLLPEQMQLVPERMQSLPERIQSVPERIQLVPERMQSVPERMQSVPERMQSMPERMQSMPERRQSVPEGMQSGRERIQPGFLNHPMTPPNINASPQGFKNIFPQQLFANGSMGIPPPQQSPRPVTSFPFPVNSRPTNSYYGSPNQNAQNLVPGAQWTPVSPQRDDFVQNDIPWQHLTQPTRMQNHPRMDQQYMQQNFIAPPPPAYHPQVARERHRTNSDGNRYSQPFQ